MGTANRVAKNTLFLYARMGVTVFISLYTTRILLEALGATDYGIFNVVGGAIALLGFLNAAMTSASQRFMSFALGEGDNEKQIKIFNVSIILHFIISILIGIVLYAVGKVYFNGFLNIQPDRIFAAKVIYNFMILSTMFTVIAVPYEAILNAHENMLYYSIIGIVQSVLRLIVAFVVVYTLKDKLIVFGVLTMGISLITLIIVRIYVHKKYDECKFAAVKYWDKKLMKEMTSFAGWSFLGSSSSMIAQYGQGIILNIFFGPIANAAQGIANQISGQAGALGPQISKSLEPVIVKSVSVNDKESTFQSIIFGTKAMLFVEAILFLPIILETSYILKFWLKEVPPNAEIFITLLLIVNLIDTTYIFLAITIGATGRIKKFQIVYSILSILSITISLLAFYMGAPPYAIYISMLFISVMKLISASYFANRLYQLSIKFFINRVLSGFVISFTSAIIICMILISIVPSGLARFIYVALLSMGSFSILFYYVGFNGSEKKMLKSKLLYLKSKLVKNGRN
ncbi:oligosaccharide flippase family protein [Saccharicrinis sp. FJH62]|uniref:oligosaccharide flippase family protein n=1 Tax=Saccharicrinis sp. FJH62 TaxID=3344657 RepID=UPI0035D4C3CA